MIGGGGGNKQRNGDKAHGSDVAGKQPIDELVYVLYPGRGRARLLIWDWANGLNVALGVASEEEVVCNGLVQVMGGKNSEIWGTDAVESAFWKYRYFDLQATICPGDGGTVPCIKPIAERHVEALIT